MQESFQDLTLLCKKAHIKHCGDALDFKNHANMFVWKCLDCYDYCDDVLTKVHGPSREMSLYPLG